MVLKKKEDSPKPKLITSAAKPEVMETDAKTPEEKRKAVMKTSTKRKVSQ